MKVLITGFGPFPGVPRNPAGQAAARIGRMRRPALAQIDRHVLVLPTEWRSLALLEDTIRQVRPDAILMLGVASRRRNFAVEVQAVNAARGLDAARRRPPGRLSASGRQQLRLRGSAPRLAFALRNSGIACYLSRDAGRYLCNGAYYVALAATTEGKIPVVFLHLPGRGKDARRPAVQVGFALSEVLVALLRAH